MLNGLLRYHEMTAILDKIARGRAAGATAPGYGDATNCFRTPWSNCWPRSKRLRDTEASRPSTCNSSRGGTAACRKRGDGRRDRRRAQHLAPAPYVGGDHVTLFLDRPDFVVLGAAAGHPRRSSSTDPAVAAATA